MRSLGLQPKPCGDTATARSALTNCLFDVVFYRWLPDPGGVAEVAAAHSLFQELAACPTPLVALADRQPQRRADDPGGNSSAIEGVAVPDAYVHDGRIMLNVGPTAVEGLSLGNDWIRFSARFSAKSFNIECPPSAVLAIYARENGRGMAFGAEDNPEPTDPDPPPDEPAARKGPFLRVVK